MAFLSCVQWWWLFWAKSISGCITKHNIQSNWDAVRQCGLGRDVFTEPDGGRTGVLMFRVLSNTVIRLPPPASNTGKWTYISTCYLSVRCGDLDSIVVMNGLTGFVLFHQSSQCHEVVSVRRHTRTLTYEFAHTLTGTISNGFYPTWRFFLNAHISWYSFTGVGDAKRPASLNSITINVLQFKCITVEPPAYTEQPPKRIPDEVFFPPCIILSISTTWSVQRPLLVGLALGGRYPDRFDCTIYLISVI